MTEEPNVTQTPAVGRLHMVRSHFATDEGVYGVILVAGMVFLSVVGTVIVFWAAHVYAGTVAHHGFEDGRIIGIRDSLGAALRRSWGLLVSALIPCSILLLGVIKAVPDAVAVWTALWGCVAVLAVLGYIAFARRGARWHIRLLGALATAGFGILMILLKAGIHH
jgi:ABC-type multidrug transport system permease subunit